MERKISFYLLTAKNKENKSITNSDIEKLFNSMYNELKRGYNKHKIDIIENYKHDPINIEIIKYENSKIFFRFGQKKPKNTFSIYDMESFESKEVEMTENQYLSMYTYAMIDFEYCILLYINVSGAPTYTIISRYFKSKFENMNVNLSPILTKDIIDIISSKDVISNIQVQISVPSDEILSDMGISWDDYRQSENIKTCIQTFEVRAKSNKNLLSQSTYIKKLIDNLRLKFNTSINKISIKAKNDKEKSKTYNLEMENFTKTIDLKDEMDLYQSDEEFINILERVFLENIDDLKNFIR